MDHFRCAPCLSSIAAICRRLVLLVCPQIMWCSPRSPEVRPAKMPQVCPAAARSKPIESGAGDRGAHLEKWETAGAHLGKTKPGCQVCPPAK